MQVTALRSHRCYHYPQGSHGQPATNETGVLPFVQVRAVSATHALRAASAITGCVIESAERIEGDAA